jgi:hypothetical protein
MFLNKKKVAVWLIGTAGIFFIISALGQGFYAIPEIKNTVRNLHYYWFNRIHMYCWLVNLSMWMMGILVLYGAYALNRGRSHYLIITIPALYAFIMGILILIFTPSDWWHTIFIFAGVVLIFIPLILNLLFRHE